MNPRKIAGYFYICKKCGEVIQTKIYNVITKKEADVCRDCYMKYRKEFTGKTITTKCEDCCDDFTYKYKGRAYQHYCDTCKFKRKQEAMRLFKREYDRHHNKIYTQLGTHKIKQKKEMLHSDCYSYKCNEADGLDIFEKLYNEYQENRNTKDWYWDSSVQDFVTDYVFVWLYKDKPKVI